MSLKEASKKALWFLDSFHIDIKSIIVKFRRKHEVITLDYSTTEISHPSHHRSQLIDETLYLLDAFNISDEFYHHLSMIHPQHPCSYIVKAKRDDISSNVVILRLPKPYFGFYRPKKEYISELLIRKVSYSIYFIDVQIINRMSQSLHH